MDEISILYKTIQEVSNNPKIAKMLPRTQKLVNGGRNKIAKKVGEEAVEVALEAGAGRRKGTIEESADLIYNLTVLWSDMDINPKEIWDEMARRRQKMGVAEKLPKEGTLTNIDAPTARLLLLRSVKDFPMGKRGQKIASDNIANLSDQDVFKALDKMKNIGTLIHEIFEESILLNQEEITELSTHNISSSEQSEDKPIPFIR